MGKASTLAVVLFVIVAIIGAAEFKLMDRK